MAQTEGALTSIYRQRIGDPDTADEVRGYWVFTVGLLVGLLGIVSFLMSVPPEGAAFSRRELAVVLTAIGLAMLVAGFVIRLPLSDWANYAAYAGQAICLGAAAWFMVIYPTNWSVQAGNQPVIVLYAVGLLVIAVGGVIAPLIAGRSAEDLAAERVGREADRANRDAARAADREAAAADRADADADEDDLGAALERARGDLEAVHRSQAQFELYEDRGGKWRWRLRHRNSNVIADSGQGYTRKHNARKGLASVRRNALGASMLEIVPEAEKDPDEALDAVPTVPAETSRAAFEVYEDAGEEYRWRLVHDNGTIIADSGEGYTRHSEAERAVERVRESVGPAPYLRFDPASFELYRDRGGEYRWRLVHKNGNIVAAASEGYTRRTSARDAIETVRDGIDDAERIEVYEDRSGEFRWRFTAANGEIVATSGEGYTDRSEAEAAVERVREYVPEADALDATPAVIEVYRDASEEWRWRLRHRNGNILADGGEGYASRHGIHDAIEGVKRWAPGASVES